MAIGHLTRRVKALQRERSLDDLTEYMATQRNRIRQQVTALEQRMVEHRMTGSLIRYGGTTDGYSDGAVLQCAGDELDYTCRR